MNFKDDRQGRLVKTVKSGKFDILVTVDQNGKYGYILRRGYSNVSHGANFASEEGAIYAANDRIKSFGHLYDSACSYMDSVIGNIARKIEDEFNENDHPRDKGGKFTTKGGEGKGGRNPLDEDKKQKRYENAMAKAKKENPSWSRKDLETYGRGLAKKLEKDPIPETETEKAAKEELASTKSDEETLEGLDDYGEKLLEYASDIDTANDALRALNWDTHDYDDLEQAQTALKEAISQNPKAAKELWESTTNKEDTKYKADSEEAKASKETDDILEEFSSSGIDMVEAMEDLGLSAYGIPEGHVEEAFSEELYGSKALREEAKKYIKRYRGEDLVEDIQKELRRNTSTDVEDLIDYARDDGYDAELESEEYMIVRKNGKEYRAHIDKVGSTYYVDKVEEL